MSANIGIIYEVAEPAHYQRIVRGAFPLTGEYFQQ